MTVLTPTQRQFIFTSSLSERFERHQPFFDRMRLFIREGIRRPVSLVPVVIPAIVILNVGWVLVSGVHSVLLSSDIRRVSDAIKQEETRHDSLEAQKAEILSPDALKTYASMVQLSNPVRVEYITQTQDHVAVSAALHPVQ